MVQFKTQAVHVEGALEAIQLIIQLVGDGRIAVAALQDLLTRHGATPEELARLDVRLSDAIAAREAERAAEGEDAAVQKPAADPDPSSGD